jgi:hypothetical protein
MVGNLHADEGVLGQVRVAGPRHECSPLRHPAGEGGERGVLQRGVGVLSGQDFVACAAGLGGGRARDSVGPLVVLHTQIRLATDLSIQISKMSARTCWTSLVRCFYCKLKINHGPCESVCKTLERLPSEGH